MFSFKYDFKTYTHQPKCIVTTGSLPIDAYSIGLSRFIIEDFCVLVGWVAVEISYSSLFFEHDILQEGAGDFFARA